MNKISFPALGLEFNADPILIHYKNGGGVHWYGVIIAFGILLAVLYCSYVAKRENEKKDTILDIVLYATPIAIVFARTYYVVFSWEQYKSNPADVFKIWEGGLAIYGAIIGAVLTAWVYCKIKKLNTMKIFDICCLGLLIGQCIGRWGNFVNAEAHGGVCNAVWAMSINSAPAVHPTFLYESLWNLVGFAALALMNKKRPFYGFTFYSYLIWYGAGRYVIEGMRTDSLRLCNVRVSQIVALICVVTGAAALIVTFTKKKKHKKT